jgi:hypothetical protein
MNRHYQVTLRYVIHSTKDKCLQQINESILLIRVCEPLEIDVPALPFSKCGSSHVVGRVGSQEPWALNQLLSLEDKIQEKISR